MKNKKYLSLLLQKIEGKLSLSDKFHEKTNNQEISPVDFKKTPKAWSKIHFKTYPRFQRMNLDYLTQTKGVADVMRQRRSVREFSNKSISKAMLSYILYSACGIIKLDKNIDNSRRPYPSAGARYPLEVYLIILGCKGLDKGLYHYNVLEHKLELIINKDLSNWLSKTMGKETWVLSSSIVFIITAVLDRVRIKYAERGYRYALLEAGHLAQNLCLLTTELGLGSCPIGGYIDSEVDKLLDITHAKEVTLYLIAVGKV